VLEKKTAVDARTTVKKGEERNLYHFLPILLLKPILQIKLIVSSLKTDALARVQPTCESHSDAVTGVEKIFAISYDNKYK